MNESIIREAKTATEKALERLNLQEVDEQDIEKIISNLEDAKNVLEEV